MKKLILVRHGHYNSTDDLTIDGQMAIRRLTRRLASHTKGKISVISSKASRAFQSAKIVVEMLKQNTGSTVKLSKDDLLYPSTLGFKKEMPDLLQMLKSIQDKFDTVVFVTHYEFCEHFPSFYFEEEWNKKIPPRELEKAEACVMDCELQLLAFVTHK